MRRLTFIALACGISLLAQKKPVTIETAARIDEPREMRGNIAWAPDGKHFAYRRGKAIMLYDVSAKSEKDLLSLEPLEKAAVQASGAEQFDWQNRRVSESSFAWSASGNEMLLSVGGDLFLWHKDNGKWDQLTSTPVAERDPKLSPDGTRVAFRREHDLHSMEIASRKVTRLTNDGTPTLLNGELDWVYPEELDLSTAFWWSPDSQRIAYLQFDISHEFQYPQLDLLHLRAMSEPERYPQAGTPNADVRVGVVQAAGGNTRWLDLGETRGHLIARVHWTPDSSALAIERLNRVQNQLDLLLADAREGAARTVLHETDPFWVNLSDAFHFLSDGRFVWSSERDGYRHLYLYSLEGKQLSRLTSGNWEVTQLAGVNEARKTAYFVSTEASPLERHLYSVQLDGRAKTRLTQEAGTHAISMGATAEYYLDTYSSLTNPPRRTLHTMDGREWSVYREADRRIPDEYDILPTEIVQVKASDGTHLYARMIKPAHFQPDQKYPAVVMVYGGPHAQSVRNAWTGATWDQVLAHRGFVIWQLDNRGAAGRGHVFETPLYRRLGKTELADQLDGVRHLVAQGFVDAGRIGIYGWSYGGYMTLYSLLNAPDTFRAGIAGAPVTKWQNYDTIYTERYLGLPSENADGYRQSSAVEYADRLKAKLLIVHNIEDDNVLFQNTMQMSEALQRAGKLFDMVIYPQKTHGVSGPLRKQLLEKTTEFFEKNLK
jgi:dipeptidyl-peptidase-4